MTNGGCEATPADLLPTDLSGWTVDSGLAVRAPGIGSAGSDGCLLVGPAVLRSPTFTAAAGSTWLLKANVSELRDDAPTSVVGEDPDPSRDSVISLEFFTIDGKEVGDYQIYCDEYVDRYDVATGTILQPGGDLECDALAGMQAVSWPSTVPTVAAKFRVAPVAPAGAATARVLLGGSLATDTVDPLFTGVGLNSATTINVFDDVEASTA